MNGVRSVMNIGTLLFPIEGSLQFIRDYVRNASTGKLSNSWLDGCAKMPTWFSVFPDELVEKAKCGVEGVVFIDMGGDIGH
jgi:hypothetical protein